MNLSFSRDKVALFEKRHKIGEGTYAIVYHAVERATGREVAIKKIKASSFTGGLDVSALREIKYLREIKHRNIVEVHIPRKSATTLSFTNLVN